MYKAAELMVSISIGNKLDCIRFNTESKEIVAGAVRNIV